MVPPSFEHFAPLVLPLQWYGGNRTGLQGKGFSSARLRKPHFTLKGFEDTIPGGSPIQDRLIRSYGMDGKPIRQIALIGFGEVGGIFGSDFSSSGFEISTFDILLESEPSRSGMLAKARNAKVRACDKLEEALTRADLVISAVTACSAANAARSAAPHLRSGQTYLDINSVSPDTKREIERAISESPAQFVEAAVMAPVSPQRLKVPMLLGGPHAAQAAGRLQRIGMNAKAVSERVGVASAIKMCRSIVIKGMEAIVVESMLTARRYGAEQPVLESLAATYPGMGWEGALPDYLISRVAEPGKRRAAEMREAAQAIVDAGLEPLTALGTAQRQDWLAQVIAEHGLPVPRGEAFSWRELADAIAGITSPQEKSSAEAK
jgi:3-hydroxyisobutyrate dehydrogenase-like beta-hydroxyacid dehydrogenase